MQDFPTSPDPQQPPQQPVQQPQMPPPPSQLSAYPPTFAPPPAPPTPGTLGTPPTNRNRNKILLGTGIGCGLLLVLCMCAGLVSTLAALAPSTAGNAPTATTAPQSYVSSPASTVPPTATPKPKPKPTVNPNAGAPAYAAIVMSDGTILGGDLQLVSDDCGSATDLATCRGDLVAVTQDADSFVSDLNGHPTPPCLVMADKPLRAAIRDVKAAAQEVIDGIDNYDVSKIDDGAALMRKATTEIQDASSALDAVNCA